MPMLIWACDLLKFPAVGPVRVREVETISVRVPLGRTYKGSAYKMTHRSTVVVRLHTDQGVTGEAYAGDEDAALLGDRRNRAQRDRSADHR